MKSDREFLNGIYEKASKMPEKAQEKRTIYTMMPAMAAAVLLICLIPSAIYFAGNGTGSNSNLEPQTQDMRIRTADAVKTPIIGTVASVEDESITVTDENNYIFTIKTPEKLQLSQGDYVLVRASDYNGEYSIDSIETDVYIYAETINGVEYFISEEGNKISAE